MKRRILVVEDNRELARILELHFLDMGCAVDLAFDGMRGLERARASRYDLIILDIMLPGMDGLELCRQIRQTTPYTPVLMLTAKTTEIDRVLGLEMGADDYVTKPFSIPELLARIKAIFRRVDMLKAEGTEGTTESIVAGGLSIDPERRRVERDGRLLELTAREFDLLLFFARRPGKVFNRAQLLDAVWGYGHEGYEHTVNSHINRLRAKIENDPRKPCLIQTVWGIGYKFAEPEETP